MKKGISAAAWVPGLPFVLQADKSPDWRKLHEGMQALATHVRELSPESIVLYSTQWLSVLGTSFQVQPNPKGLHVDENWYEWGDLSFDFKCDAALGEKFAKAVTEQGFPTKTVNYDAFPIDTGTIVAMRYLNPEGKIPVNIVSSWVYANHEKSFKIGQTMRDVIERNGKKTLVVASSLLSTRYFTEEIDPATDRISNAEDDSWNKKLVGVFETGEFEKGSEVAREFAVKAPVDMQLNAYHWLQGVLSGTKWSGQVLAYGPQWGTGAAVAEFRDRGAK